jgi:hypothetical protein
MKRFPLLIGAALPFLLWGCPEDVSSVGKNATACVTDADCSPGEFCALEPPICIQISDGGESATDAGLLPDAGPPLQDAGSPSQDAGLSPPDAGPLSEAGLPLDAGTMADGGNTGVDGGPNQTDPDGGAADQDGGPPPLADAGPVCTANPSGLTLNCDLSSVTVATCDATVADDADGSAWATCLECQVRLKPEVIYTTDFGDLACDLDGWTVSSGDNCRDHFVGCIEGGATETCCDDVGYFCVDGIPGSRHTIRANKDCPANKGEEVRLRRALDLSNHKNARVCVDYSTLGAAGNDENGVMLVVEDSQMMRTQLSCFSTDEIVVDGQDRTLCANIPDALHGQVVTLELIVHSEVGGEEIYVDALQVEAALASCPATPIEITDDFTGCSQGNDSLSDWNVTLGDLRCENGWSCGGNQVPVAEVDEVVLERVFDLTAFDGQIELCLDLGQDGANGGESMEVAVNASTFYSVVLALDDSSISETNKMCAEHCVDLSAQLPGVANNPAVGVRIRAIADDKRVGPDHLEFRGVQNCDPTANGLVSTSAISGAGGNAYAFTITNQTSSRLDLVGTCALPDDSLSARDDFYVLP